MAPGIGARHPVEQWRFHYAKRSEWWRRGCHGISTEGADCVGCCKSRRHWRTWRALRRDPNQALGPELVWWPAVLHP